MFDKDGEEAIKALNQGRSVKYQESQKNVREVAENAKFGVGKERCGFQWGRIGTKWARVISLDKDLAAKSPKELAAAETPAINLKTLTPELIPM